MFDNPDASLQTLPFEKRYETLIYEISLESQLLVSNFYFIYIFS